MELQRSALRKNVNKAVIHNRILEAVVNNLPIFIAGGKVNRAGGTQVTFPNSEDGWILGSRWRELHLNKDALDRITKMLFCAPTT